MSIEAILARWDLSLIMYTGGRFVYQGSKKDHRLKLVLEGDSGGVALKIEHVGRDFDETVAELWAKWCKATTGLPELAAPMIEHQPSPVAPGDEIPF